MIKAKHFAMLPPETEIDVAVDSPPWIKFSKPGAEYYLYTYSGVPELRTPDVGVLSFKSVDECFDYLAWALSK